MKRVFLVFLCFLLLGCASERKLISRSDKSSQKTASSQRLNQLFHDYFEEILRLYPGYATFIGDHRYDDQFANTISEKHRLRREVLFTQYLGALSNLPKGTLNGQDRLNYDLFKRRLKMALEGMKFSSHLIPVRQIGSTPLRFPLLGSGRGIHPFKTVKDYDNFLSRMKGFQVWVDTAMANMLKGVKLGVVQPRIIMKKTLPQLDAMIVSDVKKSIFYQPIIQMPASFDEIERARLTRDYKQAIEQRIIPTYKKLHAFIKDEYLPKCRSAVGLSAIPGGRKWYAHLVKVHTTTDMSPDEIFQIGVNEVERIKKEMEKLRDKIGFRGSLVEFSKHLAKNTQSYTTKDNLVKAYKQLRGKIAPELAKLFGRLPKAPYEIRPVEEFRENSASSQYWAATPDGSRPGIFYVNAGGVNKKPAHSLEWLFLHEAMPGHHFQISLQREQSGLPKFRRFGRYTAYSEGWGLYAESLGRKLGFYADSFQYFRRLEAEMWRARRLVVDVGLHYKGWTRDEAIKFMMENPGAGKSGATREVDRYISIPGQALAYKIGQLKISAIRAKAEKTLGSKFDIRTFHDEVLKDGALPLDVLEAKMDTWISSQQQ